MSYFLGLDGGGSQTRALLIDEKYQICRLGISGASNFHEVGTEKALHHIQSAVNKAMDGESLDRVAGAFAGFAGVVNAPDRLTALSLLKNLGLPNNCRMDVDHDIRIALAGGLAGKPGIALIAGTGSSCYGRDADGNAWQCGGWGSLADDIGSASWIARKALELAVRQADGRRPKTDLLDGVFEFLEISRIEDFIHRIHIKGLPRDQLAKLAPRVLELKQRKDPDAEIIISEALDGLIELVAVITCKLALPSVDVCLAGGLFKADHFRSDLVENLMDRVPGSSVTESAFSPVVGAVIEAVKLTGKNADITALKKLETLMHL